MRVAEAVLLIQIVPAVVVVVLELATAVLLAGTVVATATATMHGIPGTSMI